MSVNGSLESAILDAISHNQEIGKKSGLLEEKVFLRVTQEEEGVSKVSCIALNWIQRLARTIFGCYSDTHLSNVIPVLSDENFRSIEKSAAYVLDQDLRRTVKSLIRLREEYLKSHKPNPQEGTSTSKKTPVASALKSLIGPILFRKKDWKLTLLGACLDAMKYAEVVQSAVYSLKVSQEDEKTQLEQNSKELQEQREQLDLQCKKAEKFLQRSVKVDGEEGDEVEPTVRLSDDVVQRTQKFLEEQKRTIEFIDAQIAQNQKKIYILTAQIPELKARKFLEEIQIFMREDMHDSPSQEKEEVYRSLFVLN